LGPRGPDTTLRETPSTDGKPVMCLTTGEMNLRLLISSRGEEGWKVEGRGDWRDETYILHQIDQFNFTICEFGGGGGV